MSWKPLRIRGLSFIGPSKEPAFLKFESGLNVICGASNTGKSFTVEAIDFLLGSGKRLNDIPERVGYDRARLVLQTADDEFRTLERNTGGGDFALFEEDVLLDEPSREELVLQLNPQTGRNPSLSTYLLSLIGLEDKYLQKNKKGDTQRLGFRNLIKLVVIPEDEIIKSSSPILTGQYTLMPAEYSLLKLLLTGVDASGLKATTALTTEVAVTRQSNSNKVDLIDELIAESYTELIESGISRPKAENRLLKLENEAKEQQENLAKVQGDLDERVERRRSLIHEANKLSGRIDEINGLLARFDLLKDHYHVDLERLAAIEESGSLFVHLNRKPCPLCGATPDNQHIGEQCDGDVASVIRAATAEILKVKKLSVELSQTMADLRAESEQLATQKAQITSVHHALNEEIQALVSPLKEAQNSFSEVVKQSGDLIRLIDKYERIEDLEKRKAKLLVENINPDTPPADPSTSINETQVDLSAKVLDDFAQTVQQLLKTWHFPDSDRVHFDEKDKDIVINGQPRASRGKGFRAITHAAMTIGLMEFCKDRNLSHPGFVVLDSPLLAYYAPESAEDSLVGSDLKVRFYDYLANNHSDSQIIRTSVETACF